MVLVGSAANVVLCLVSLIQPWKSHASRTFGKYSHHLASVQDLARVLFRLRRIMQQVLARAWVAEAQRHMQGLPIAWQGT